MDFRLTDEQSLLDDSLKGWLARRYDFSQWKKLIAQTPPFSSENWGDFADMGWLGLAVPEQFGGLDLGGLEEMLIAQAFGYHLVTEPYLSSVVLGAGLIDEAGTVAQKDYWLPRIAAGELRLAVALTEPKQRFSLNRVATRAVPQDRGYSLSGTKSFVLDGPSADRLIVVARTSGDDNDTVGLSLFIVDPTATGLSLRGYRTVDDRQAADLVLDGVTAGALLGDVGNAHGAIERVADRAVSYLCGEGVGAMQALLDATLAYVKIRNQFGKAIGEFQVIQHRIVDLRVQIDSARGLATYAACSLKTDPVIRTRAVSAAKVQVGRSARIVGRDAIQLHGGIGMTNELSIGQHFKRLQMVETMLGDIDHHQRRFASLPSALLQ